MSEKYFRMRAKADDLPFARAFERYASTIRMPEHERQDWLAWAFALSPNTSWDRIVDEAYAHAERRGYDITNVGLLESWRNNIVENGLPAEPVQQATDDDRRRLAEIKQDMMGDRRDSNYWNDGGKTRDEYRELLERVGIDQAPAPAADVSARKSELRAMIADRSSDYYRGPNSQVLQIEYRGILESESGAANVASSTPNQESSNGSLDN